MEKFAKLIRQHNRFLISTHAMPDGDGLGSEMALHSYLKKNGKQSYVINTHETPAKFRLVDPRGEIQVYDGKSKLPECDIVLIVDTGESKMLGSLEAPIKSLGVPIVYIDHHVPDIDDIGNHLIDEQYGSTGELIYTFLREHMRADIDSEMAMAIYVAIVTDTSSFRFKRTSPRSHLIAAELLQKGVSPEHVYQSIYARDSLAKIRLFGHILERIQTSDDERIAWLVIPRDERRRFGATVEDTEAYVTQLTLIEGVDVGMLFREEDDGRIKVSVRGNGEIPVFGIAKKFGGGGHRHAAGMKLECTLEEAVKLVFTEARSLLNGYAAQSK